MIDIVLTLVFMMVFLMFSIFPAIKIVNFIKSRRELTPKKENFLTLIFTIAIAFSAALFMKFA
jgi:hypothetical protein